MSFFDFCFHPVGLHHGELAASGCDAQFSEGHGQGEAAKQPTQAIVWGLSFVKTTGASQYEERVTLLCAADV